MLCPKCKKEIASNDAKRCSHCGASLSAGPKASIANDKNVVKINDYSWMPIYTTTITCKPGICPKCDSDNVQKLSVIVLQQTSTTTSRSQGIGVAESANGSALITSVSHSTSHSMSNLAKVVSPPEKLTINHLMRQRYSGIFEKMLLGLIRKIESDIEKFSHMLGGIFAIQKFALIFGKGLFEFIETFYCSIKYKNDYAHYVMQVYPKSYENWEKSWFCNKCGTISTE